MKKRELLKRINIFSLCLLVLFLGACSADKTKDLNDKLNVVAVNFVQYDFARSISQNLADVSMIMRPGAESHGYEPTLSDIKKIENADIFIYNGGESDEWVRKILSSVRTDKMKKLSMMNTEGIRLYEEEHAVKSHIHGKNGEGHHHKHSHHVYDEHIWTSPSNARVMVAAIADAMSEADEKNKEKYMHNAGALLGEIEKIDSGLESVANDIGDKMLVVADRFPFLYMAKDYGLNYISAFSACSPESDAGPGVIAHIADEVKEHEIKAVFHIELSNEKMADVICANTGAQKLLLHSCQTVSVQDFENGIGYVDIMKNNIKNLKAVTE